MSWGTRNRIRERRGVLGLTLTDVAREIDVAPRTVSRWERGESRIASEDHLLGLAHLLRVSVPFMMGWPEDNGDNGDGHGERHVA